MKSLLKNLVETAGPPGYETEIRKLVRSEIEPYADEMRVDGLGSLIARKGRADAGGPPEPYADAMRAYREGLYALNHDDPVLAVEWLRPNSD